MIFNLTGRKNLADASNQPIPILAFYILIVLDKFMNIFVVETFALLETVDPTFTTLQPTSNTKRLSIDLMQAIPMETSSKFIDFFKTFDRHVCNLKCILKGYQ